MARVARQTEAVTFAATTCMASHTSRRRSCGACGEAKCGCEANISLIYGSEVPKSNLSNNFYFEPLI